jgi:glycosyltransferase involved in cell wall biosynthesis
MARILTLTNWYPPHSFGGYEVECEDVMTGLRARGHHVQVLCSDELIPGLERGAGPIPVQRSLKMYWRAGAPWTPSTAEQLAIERANHRALDGLLERFKPDVVSVWHMGALSLSLLTAVQGRSIPMVYAVCDDWLIYGILLDPWSRRWNGNPVRRWGGNLAARALSTPTVMGDLGSSGCFCFVSATTKDSSLAASPWAYPIAPVVHAGIDRSLYPVPQGTDVRSWSWKLLFVGRLDARKGTDTLLRAMTHLPTEATLTFLSQAGGSERARLEDLATHLGVAQRIRFGSMEHSQIASGYVSHDCLIFPSEWSEPFGLAPLEAMACGIPVVATGVGGSGEFLFDGRNCLLFQAGNEVQLARCVRQMAEDEALRSSLREEGWATAEQFDIGWTVDSFEQFHVAAAEGRLAEMHDVKPSLDVTEGGAPTPLAARVTRACVDDIRGLVLAISGTGDSTDSTGVSPSDCRRVVTLHGDVLAANSSIAAAAREEAKPLGVVAGLDQLPFLSGAFAAVVCHDALEKVTDDRALVSELARVAQRGGRVIFVAPNRHSVLVLRARLRNWWKGWRRPPAHYFTSKGHVREYSWAELEQLIAPAFRVHARVPIGREENWKRKLASRLLVGPLRAVSPTMVVRATPR